jgi:hypothetical protein
MTSFLQKKSFGFYHFENEVSNGTLLISINNQHKKCLDVYVRKGSDRASSGENDQKVVATNDLLVQNTFPGPYSITLEANENCQFTIEVTTSTYNVSRINKGSYKDLSLPKGQTAYLLF